MTADAGKRTAAADRAPAGDAAPGKGATKTRAARQKTKREPAAKKPPLSPDLAVVQTHVFRGPNYWSYEPCIRLLVDLGSLEFWPSNTIPGFNKKLLKALPGVGEHSCSLGKKGGFKERLEDGTWMGHVAEHVALGTPARDRCAHLPGQDQERRPAGAVQRDLRLRRGDRRPGGGRPRRPSVEPPDQGRRRVRLRSRAGSADPARRTPAVRPLDAGDHRRSRHPRHPVDPVERTLPGPAGPGDLPAADPRHDDLQDQCARRRRRRRQEDDEPPAGLGRAAGPAQRGGAHRGRCRRGRQADRVPRGDQAAGRQPRPRGGVGPAHRPRRARRVQAGGVRSAPRSGGGGVLRHRQRLSRAGDRRAHGGDRRAGPGPRHRRRQAHDRPAGGEGQPGSTPWHRPREGADPHQDRRCRARPGEEAGVRARGRPAQGRTGIAGRHRQHVDGGHLDRPHLGRARGQRGDRRRSGARRRLGRRRHRLPRARHLRAGARDRWRHRRGQRRAGVPDAHPPHRRRAAVRGEVRRRRVVPAGFAEPDPDPGGDGVQRQDHHHAHAGAHLPRAWAGAWA